MKLKSFLPKNPRRFLKFALIVVAVMLVAGVVWAISGFRAAETVPSTIYTNGGILTVVVSEQAFDPATAVGQVKINGDCQKTDSTDLGPSPVTLTTVRGSTTCAMVRDANNGKGYFQINELVFSSYRASRSYTIPTTTDGQILPLTVPGKGATIRVTIAPDDTISSFITQN